MTIAYSPSTPLTIALVDGFDSGHHLTYVRLFTRSLLAQGHRVMALLPDPAALETWVAEELGSHRDQLALHPFRHARAPSPFWRLRTLWSPLAAWHHAARSVAAVERSSGWRADLVFFCWLDDYIVGVSPLCRFALPTLFRRPWSGLFFHPWHLRAPAAEDVTPYAVSTGILRARNCRRVAVLDEGVTDQLQRRIDKPVICFPDLTDERLPEQESERVRQLRAAVRGRKVIGLFGELSRRKGVAPFLKAAALARDRDWVFLLAGALGEAQLRSYFPDEREFVESALQGDGRNVIVLRERIEDEREFNAVIAQCDVLFAAYETFGHSSNMVAKAAAFQKPMLVSPGYCMAERVARFRLGLAVDPHDTAAVVDELATLLDAEALARRVGASDFDGYQREHSLTALSDAFEGIIALTGTARAP